MSHRGLSWTTAHVLTLAAAGLVLLVANRNQWFYGDEWAFIADRGPGFAQLDLFRPHNEHWSTIPVLIYWALLAKVGLSSYLPYVGVVILLHLLLAHLLWRASLRAGARPAVATGLAGVFAVLGAGAENLLWAFQMGFVGAIACGWLAVLLHDHDGRFGLRDVAGWVASLVALMFSGPAVALVGVSTLAVWLRRRRGLDTVLTAAVPAAVFVVWWWRAGRYESGPPSHSDDRWLVVDWAWTGLAHAGESIVGVPEVGGLLVLVLGFWCIRHLGLASGPAAPAFAGVAGALAFFLLTGLERASLGMGSALAMRYAYVAAALLLPATALALTRAVPAGRATSLALLAVCALVAAHNVGLLRSRASTEMARERPLGGVLVATARLLKEGGYVGWSGPLAQENPNLAPEDLLRIDGYGWLPEVGPTRHEVLAAEALAKVAVVPTGGELGAVSVTGGDVNLVPAASREGTHCVEARPVGAVPQVALGAPTSSWRVRLDAPASSTVDVHVIGDDHASAASELDLPAEPSDLVSEAPGRTIVVTLPTTGPTTLCGVARI